MYRVSYTQGNGYNCSCCRRTWEGTEDFINEKDMIDYLVRKLYVVKNPKESSWEDEYDWDLDEIREIKDEDLTSRYYEIASELVENKNTIKARKIKLIKIAEKYKKELGEYEED